MDANSIIYSVEHIDPYYSILQPIWETAKSTELRVVTSELTLLEVLVKPMKTGNAQLEAAFRELLQQANDVDLLPITQPLLEQAAKLRVTANLKTPDAIHAATALITNCALFVTNDVAFRRVTELPTLILSEIVPSE